MRKLVATLWLHRILVIFFILLAHSSVCFAAPAGVTEYLKTNKVKPEIIKAIENKKVILVMCTMDAIAAAGRPLYKIGKTDPKWPKSFNPIQVISSQCSSPDSSEIWLKFSNFSQYETSESVMFTVKFTKGRVTKIWKGSFDDEG